MATLFLILRSLFTRQRLAAMFFLTVTVLLFFDDGKQPLLDVVGAAAVFVLTLLAPKFAEMRRGLPLPLLALWICSFIVTAVGAALSDDLGYSLYAASRVVGAGLLYWLFYAYTSRETIHAFGKWLLLFTFLALIGAAAATILAHMPIIGFVPKMSLLVGRYGHHAIINILLLTMPLVVWFWLNRGGIVPLSAFVLVLFSIGLSFTRVGLALTVVYVLVASLMHRGAPILRRIMTSVTAVIFVGAIAVLMFTPLGQEIATNVTWVTAPKAEKRLTLTDPRSEFWRQAYATAIERPLFGGGPGTFALQSYRQADNLSKGSWFAHNSVAETFAENGVVGGIVLGATVIAALIALAANFRSPTAIVFWPTDGPIVAGVILTLGYSLIDYNLNFLVIWYLLWATLGVMAGGMRENDPIPQPTTPVYVLIGQVYLAVFAGIVGIATITGVVTGDKRLSAILMPYNERSVMEYLIDTNRKQLTLTRMEQDYFEAFHRGNPRIISRLARVPADAHDPFRLLSRAWELEPANTVYLNAYFSWLAENNFRWDIGNTLTILAQRYAPPEKRENIRRMLPLTSDETLRHFHEGFVRWVGVPLDVKDYIGKAFYFLGLRYIEENNPEQAFYFFALGGYIARNTSMIVEATNVATTMLNEPALARKMLEECARNNPPGNQCSEELKYFPVFGIFPDYELEIQRL